MKVWSVVLLVFAAIAATIGAGRHGYQVDRGQLAEAVALTFQFAPQLARHYAEHGSFARLEEKSLSGAREGEYVQSVSFASTRPDSMRVTARIRETAWFGHYGGKTFAIVTDDGGRTWKCAAPTIYLGFFTSSSGMLAVLAPCRG